MTLPPSAHLIQLLNVRHTRSVHAPALALRNLHQIDIVLPRIDGLVDKVLQRRDDRAHPTLVPCGRVRLHGRRRRRRRRQRRQRPREQRRRRRQRQQRRVYHHHRRGISKVLVLAWRWRNHERRR